MNKDKARDKADDIAHGAMENKAKGRVKEVVGSAKAKIGGAVGNEELEAKGHAQNAEGKVDRMKGEIKEKLGDAKSAVKAGAGVVKEKIHEARSR